MALSDFSTLLPAPAAAAGWFGVGTALAVVVGLFAGHLKLRRSVRTNYTRKLFHFTIFASAALVHAVGGVQAVHAYALGVVTVIFLGVWSGPGTQLYEGLARERDAPHRTFYILVPLATTALGGLLSNILVGDYALVGYLATGCGDAVGEPVGVRLGRHPYRVWTLRRVDCTRTLEGSAAVLLTSWFASTLVLVAALGHPWLLALGAGLAAGMATAALEAFSPHGADNLTTMVGASLITSWLCGSTSV